MKMTKIETARIIVERKGDCRGIKCLDCFRVNFCDNDEIEIDDRLKNQFADAEAYIKRHESKTKKKDHIVDKHEMVEPKPIKLLLPNVFFCPMPDRMEVFYKNKLTDFACFKISPEGKILYSEVSGNYACYLTLQDAIKVGEKWWKGGLK